MNVCHDKSPLSRPCSQELISLISTQSQMGYSDNFSFILVTFTRLPTACRGTGARMRSAGPVHGHGGTIEPRCVTMHFRKHRGARVIGDEWFDQWLGYLCSLWREGWRGRDEACWVSLREMSCHGVVACRY